MRPSALVLLAGVVLVTAPAIAGCARTADRPPQASVVPLGTPGGASTGRADSDRVVRQMRERLAARPTEPAAAVTLAEALLRQTRVTGNAGLAMEAETALKRVLASDPAQYVVRRMLAAVYLSQHRFRDAIREADACRQQRPDDAWPYGAMGDAHLELGGYDAAFDAFDRMMARKPNAASYARVSYARELRGDLDGALQIMQMAAQATGAQDPESLAWHDAEIGHLYLAIGRPADARRAFQQAEYAFPGHPMAAEGLARVSAAEGDYAGALALLSPRIAAMPTPADLAFSGDLEAALGRTADAERHYRLAEAAWQSDVPEPTRLARFLAEHGRRVTDAVHIAEQASRDRDDIFTNDALAWAYLRAGRLDEARTAMTRALRTGSRDRTLRYHAAAIANAAGNAGQARTYLDQALAHGPTFDLIAGPAALALRASLRPTTW